MKQKFINHRFQGRAEDTLSKAEAIIEDMNAKGYVLTLRQLFYQFVGRDMLPNSEKEYKRLGSVLRRGREAGRIDWDAIEDRNRSHYGFARSQSMEGAIRGLASRLQLDPYLDQKVYIEVWVEKQALESVVARGCRKWRARYMACKGYLSTTEAYDAGKRFEHAIATGRKPILVHLGDHDPSGMDMTRDNGKRLSLFAMDGVQVDRIALNKDQIDQYKPPPNPAKVTDSRAEDYIKEFGTSSWELDALPPGVIETIISEHIEQYIDKEAWAKTLQRERELKYKLGQISSAPIDLISSFAQRVLTDDARLLDRIDVYDEWTEENVDVDGNAFWNIDRSLIKPRHRKFLAPGKAEEIIDPLELYKNFHAKQAPEPSDEEE